MRPWIPVALGVCLTATYVAPAVGGPDLAATLKRLDTREQRHYDSLDRRIRATVLLAMNDRITTDVRSMPMSQSTDGQFFTGSVSCFTGTLVSGGVDWGGNTEYAGYRVIASAPAGMTSWHATVATGGAPAPRTFPEVYAVCAKVQ